MFWFFFILAIILVIFMVVNVVNQRRVVRIFKSGNVSVSGLKGRGKDLLFCFVINKRKENYISNIEYSNPKRKYKRFEFDENVWELAGNTYRDFTDGTLNEYTYPYPDGIDYYISDAGIYFPAQYHKELERRYGSAPLFQALSRHLGDCSVHCNTQKQNRLWDKIREQGDNYIVMRWTKFIGRKFYITKLTVYDLEESAEKQIKKPWFGLGKTGRLAKCQWETEHGQCKNIVFASRLPYNYDSRRFKKILENGVKDYENDKKSVG